MAAPGRANPIFAAWPRTPGPLQRRGRLGLHPFGLEGHRAEDPALGIPTTYYGAVQLTGRRWSTTSAGDRYGGPHLPPATGSVPARIAVADPEEAPTEDHRHSRHRDAGRTESAKFKYGGDVDEAHRLAVVASLGDRDDPGDGAAAEHMSVVATQPSLTSSNLPLYHLLGSRRKRRIYPEWLPVRPASGRLGHSGGRDWPAWPPSRSGHGHHRGYPWAGPPLSSTLASGCRAMTR